MTAARPPPQACDGGRSWLCVGAWGSGELLIDARQCLKAQVAGPARGEDPEPLWLSCLGVGSAGSPQYAAVREAPREGAWHL